jgi:vesicle coat complex subunit
MTVPRQPDVALLHPIPWKLAEAFLICLAGGGFLWWVAPEPSGVRRVTLRLRHGDTEERVAACQALGQLDWKEAEAALPHLVRALKDGNPVVRREVVDTLYRISARSELVLSALRLALRDEDEIVRTKAALALGMLGGGRPMVIPALVDTLSDSSPEVREAAFVALGALEPQREHAPNPELHRAASSGLR